MTRAAEQGLMVSKPWGDSAPYDLMIECRGRGLRVQVKSTSCKRNNLYFCHVMSRRVSYSKSEVDFIAAYVVPVEVWYIIPINAFGGQGDLALAPDCETSKYYRYQEAWQLLM